MPDKIYDSGIRSVPQIKKILRQLYRIITYTIVEINRIICYTKRSLQTEGAGTWQRRRKAN